MVTTFKSPPKPASKDPAESPAKKVRTRVSTRGNRWDVTPRDWRRYQKNPSDEFRQRLLSKYVPLVRNVATRMAMGFPRSVELTDLVNTGVIGLIEAFGNFDPDRGVKFETYAVPRIRGASPGHAKRVRRHTRRCVWRTPNTIGNLRRRSTRISGIRQANAPSSAARGV